MRVNFGHDFVPHKKMLPQIIKIIFHQNRWAQCGNDNNAVKFLAPTGGSTVVIVAISNTTLLNDCCPRY